MEAYTLECRLTNYGSDVEDWTSWNRSALEQRRIDYEDDEEMSKDFFVNLIMLYQKT